MDNAEKVAAVAQLVDRWDLSPEERLRRIRAVLFPVRPVSRPSPTNDRGWPLMEGTAWERHDDPEMNR